MHDVAKEIREAGRRHAEAMRNRARTGAMKRKEEYLGARVPKELRERVIAKANSLGIPVSILIRNVLEEAFGSGADAHSAATKGAETDPGRVHEAGRYPGVIGWETITLNRSMRCVGCGGNLTAGMTVTLGLAAPGEDHVILCRKCKDDA